MAASTQLTDLERKRELRRKETAEVFTPEWLAQQMLDKIPPEVWADPSKTLLEPSCGDGIFVCLSIKKRLASGVSLFDAIRNTYAVDIMPDNIRECHLNVFTIIRDHFLFRLNAKELTAGEVRTQTILCTAIMVHNIRRTDDTLAENFDEWKTFDEMPESYKTQYLKKAESVIPRIIKLLDERTKAPVEVVPSVQPVAKPAAQPPKKKPAQIQDQPAKPASLKENDVEDLFAANKVKVKWQVRRFPRRKIHRPTCEERGLCYLGM